MNKKAGERFLQGEGSQMWCKVFFYKTYNPVHFAVATASSFE
jgi:hypothetical protein